MKILAIDIETRPATVYTWSLWQPIIGIEQIIDPGGVMCFVAKWVGEKDLEFRADWEPSHRVMVRRLWKLLDEADAVLHWNGARFDVPHIQREFMEAGMSPPAPFKQIDLMKTSKRHARFLSNKLDHVARQLGHGGKVEHEGFKLWRAVLKGDKDARARMQRYNERDVTLLEDVYLELRPWISSHPSFGAYNGSAACPRCGGADLQRRGYAVTATSRYQRLQCKACGGWSRETKRVAATSVVQI